MVLRRNAKAARRRSSAVALDPLDQPLRLPAHAVYVKWDFGRRLSVVEFDLSMHRDPGTSVGEYLSPFNGDIDGAQIYFGIQTDVFRPKSAAPGEPSGNGIGKGLLFSTWWTFDAADTRVPDDGFIQLGTHEGRFVGVRRGFDWNEGDYRVRLAREEADGDGDWFGLTVQPTEPVRSADERPAPTADPEWIGSLRFRRRDPAVPATLSAKATGFIEVYSRAATFREIPPWWCDLQAFGDGSRVLSASSEFPRYPHGQSVPNADCWYEPAKDRVHVAFGGDTTRRHRADRLFDPTHGG